MLFGARGNIFLTFLGNFLSMPTPSLLNLYIFLYLNAYSLPSGPERVINSFIADWGIVKNRKLSKCILGFLRSYPRRLEQFNNAEHKACTEPYLLCNMYLYLTTVLTCVYGFHRNRFILLAIQNVMCGLYTRKSLQLTVPIRYSLVPLCLVCSTVKLLSLYLLLPANVFFVLPFKSVSMYFLS